MPSRPIIAVILSFWLATNGWLFYHEILPQWRAGEPPPYTIDLTEEVGTNKFGASTVSWIVLKKGEPIGIGFSQVARLPDRTFELRSQFKFQDLKLLLLVDVKKITSSYHVTEEGHLLDLTGKVVLHLPDKGKSFQEVEIEVEGKVADKHLEPQFAVKVAGQQVMAHAVGKVPVSDRGSVLNPMQLLNRLPGLREGQRWRIPLVDPLGGDLSKVFGANVGELVGQVEGLTIPVLDAEVTSDTLHWNKADVPCYRIDYREPGQARTVASTWVRRADGLVLQQYAHHQLFEMTLQRVPAN